MHHSLLDLYAPGHLERGSVWFNVLQPLLIGVPLCTLRLTCRSLALQTYIRAGSAYRVSIANPYAIDEITCTQQCEALLGHLRRGDALDELTESALRKCCLPVLRWLMRDKQGGGPLRYGLTRTTESWVHNRDSMIKVAESGDTEWLRQWLSDWAMVFVLPEVGVFVALLRCCATTASDDAKAGVVAYAQKLRWSYWNQQQPTGINDVIWEAAVIAGHVPTLQSLRAQQLKGTVQLNAQWQFGEVGSVRALEWLRKIRAPTNIEMQDYVWSAALRGDVDMLEHMMRKRKFDRDMYNQPDLLLEDTITAGESETAEWLLKHTCVAGQRTLLVALRHADWNMVLDLWDMCTEERVEAWLDRFSFAEGIAWRQPQMIQVIGWLEQSGYVMRTATLVAAYRCEYHLVVTHMQNKKVPGLALPASVLATWPKRSAWFNEYLAEHMVSEHAWGPTQ